MEQVRWPAYAHTFINEDGQRLLHEGYLYKNCTICSGEFVVSKNVATQYPHCLDCQTKLDKGGNTGSPVANDT